MTEITVEFRNIADTEAALGWVSGRSIVADRPVGRAGGSGIGFNGAELLALALGGCFCNDLRYVAHDLNVPLTDIDVQVRLELTGTPPIATQAQVHVACRGANPADIERVIQKAQQSCMVSNSIARGIPVNFTQ